jgi:hypothetical protein
MSAFGQKRTSKRLTGLVALLRLFVPLPHEQEVFEGLGSRCHTLGLRAKNIGVGGQHFGIDYFVDTLDDSRRKFGLNSGAPACPLWRARSFAGRCLLLTLKRKVAADEID